ncbi:MAG: hypothetical protein PHE83_12145 [Opitutaceae bacterium]|nr:hypothetical protein [Opitutaceae bacterium]
MNKPWQICLVLIAIFAAGGVSGGLVAYRVVQRRMPHSPRIEAWGARQMERVAQELKLTPEQRARIQPIVKRNMEELARLRRQSMRAGHEILQRMETDIAAELTPEQRIKYGQILKDRREARRQRQEQRNLHGDRDRPPGPPPDGHPPPPPPPDSPPGEKPAGT